MENSIEGYRVMENSIDGYRAMENSIEGYRVMENSIDGIQGNREKSYPCIQNVFLNMHNYTGQHSTLLY